MWKTLSGFAGRKFSVKPAAALPRIVFSRTRIKDEGGGAKLVTTASPSDTKRRNERFRVGNKGQESNGASVSKKEKPRVCEARAKEKERSRKNSKKLSPRSAISSRTLLRRGDVSTFAWEEKWFARVPSQTSAMAFVRARIHRKPRAVACRSSRHRCIFQHASALFALRSDLYQNLH